MSSDKELDDAFYNAINREVQSFQEYLDKLIFMADFLKSKLIVINGCVSLKEISLEEYAMLDEWVNGKEKN